MHRHHQATLLAEEQHGLVAHSQLRGIGLSSDAIHRLGSSPQWQYLSPRVLRRVGAPRTTHQKVLHAVLEWGGDTVVSHLTAGRLWGLTGCPYRPTALTTTQRHRQRPTDARVHIVRALPNSWTTRLDAIPIVRPELLALQLFACSRYERATRLTDRLWSSRLLSGSSLSAFLADLGRRGRNGTAALRRYLDDRPGQYEPPASGLESRVMELLADAGITMDRQVDLGGTHWCGRVDFRHRSLPLALEIQSALHHRALSDATADQERRRSLEQAGYTVLEITDDMVWSMPADVVRLVAEAVAALTRR